MPVLTTLLLHKAEFSLEENMAKLREMIKLDSLSQAELIVKHAMKNQDMHAKAVEIITAAMEKIISQSERDKALREVNIEMFLT